MTDRIQSAIDYINTHNKRAKAYIKKHPEFRPDRDDNITTYIMGCKARVTRYTSIRDRFIYVDLYKLA